MVINNSPNIFVPIVLNGSPSTVITKNNIPKDRIKIPIIEFIILIK